MFSFIGISLLMSALNYYIQDTNEVNAKIQARKLKEQLTSLKNNYNSDAGISKIESIINQMKSFNLSPEGKAKLEEAQDNLAKLNKTKQNRDFSDDPEEVKEWNWFAGKTEKSAEKIKNYNAQKHINPYEIGKEEGKEHYGKE